MGQGKRSQKELRSRKILTEIPKRIQSAVPLVLYIEPKLESFRDFLRLRPEESEVSDHSRKEFAVTGTYRHIIYHDI